MAEQEDKREIYKTENEKNEVDSAINGCDEQLQKVVVIDVPAGSQCYCSKPRDFSVADFQCSVCYKWFHTSCIVFNIGKSLPFLTAYHFMCKKCNTNGEEVYSRKQANFTVMCQSALANLMWRNNGRLYFSEEKELIPFLDEFWEELTTQPRRSNNSWHPNIHRTLTCSDAFKTVFKGENLFVCLSNTEISKMGPSYDRFRALTSQLRTNINKHGASNVVAAQSASETVDPSSTCQGSHPNDGDTSDSVGAWRKRKSPGVVTLSTGASSGSLTTGLSGPIGSSGHSGMGTLPSGGFDHAPSNTGAGGDSAILSRGGAASGSTSTATGLVRSTRRATGAALSGSALAGSGSLGIEEGRTKLNAFGFPIDHPLNKEGYRYILVELDRHAKGRDQWDECEQTGGKPIPGLFYRVVLSPQVVISQNDRACYLKLHESQLSVTGEKGYCMCRATHGVHSGAWYFEATITEQPDGSATRIGWSQVIGNLQGPCGYDKFSYSWRSRFGTAFHDSRGRHYTETGYKKDDVIGCMIYLPTYGSPLCSLESTQTAVPMDVDQPTRTTPAASPAPPLSSPIKEKLTSNFAEFKSTTGTTFVLPETYKDRPLVKFRNSYYFEEKDEMSKVEKQLRTLVGSQISFYRNGECMGTAFSDLYTGIYYPAISIYRSATVSVNFGPTFKYPPNEVDNCRPLTDRLMGAAVEQTLADILYLIEKDNLIEQLIKSYAKS